MEHTKDLRENFIKDGYVFLPGFLSPVEVEAIKQNFDRVITEIVPVMQARHVFYEGPEKKASTLKQLIDIQDYDAFFKEKLSTGKFKDLAAFLLEDKVIGKTLEYFNKPPLIGKPTPPHQDGYYFMLNPSVAVTMWMALEPADEENGCVKYIRGSHLKGMRPHGRTQTLGFSQGITDFGTAADLEEEISFPANPGDLIIHHSLTIHQAGANGSGRSRKALGLIYFGESAREDLEAKSAYQKKLQEEQV
ncbi:phytanoyl-CoA dioxygenase family protein [Pedobacter ginsengisoli]|uniref:phytanoyl-CoA dioxygenase family protein n=1 Tax=Pedobacter ginsengisoli TaxID=363852 RepID=UPI00254B0741|nr:phytanoyl-CoA dioxygenase family protein [Pedobacter ginsengisoli]